MDAPSEGTTKPAFPGGCSGCASLLGGLVLLLVVLVGGCDYVALQRAASLRTQFDSALELHPVTEPGREGVNKYEIALPGREPAWLIVTHPMYNSRYSMDFGNGEERPGPQTGEYEVGSGVARQGDTLLVLSRGMLVGEHLMLYSFDLGTREWDLISEVHTWVSSLARE